MRSALTTHPAPARNQSAPKKKSPGRDGQGEEKSEAFRAPAAKPGSASPMPTIEPARPPAPHASWQTSGTGHMLAHGRRRSPSAPVDQGPQPSCARRFTA